MDSAAELVRLYTEKFDLLQTGSSSVGGGGRASGGGGGPHAGAIKCVEELKAVISTHLKVRVGVGVH